ncbi:MAG: hypothetical protein ABI670_15090 [Chloroflexota bacterium]
MKQDNSEQNIRRGEDYGGPADYDDASGEALDKGKYSGGTAGTTQGSSEGEQFGEFENTGKGTDLTREMEENDPRSGLVKGGQQGAADIAGPAQYGGETGGVSKG